MLLLDSRRRFDVSLTSIGPTIPQPSKGKEGSSSVSGLSYGRFIFQVIIYAV
jgi:hypothetical protein